MEKSSSRKPLRGALSFTCSTSFTTILFAGFGRNAARGFSNILIISLQFAGCAKPFRNLPIRFQLVKFRRTYPGLRIGFGVVNDDLLFQSVVIQSPVALGQMHLFAA